jgi:hypothetical protein
MYEILFYIKKWVAHANHADIAWVCPYYSGDVYDTVWQLNSGFRGGVLILTIMVPSFLSSSCDQKILGFCQQPFIFFSSFFRFVSLISALPLHTFKAALLYVFLSNLFSIFFSIYFVLNSSWNWSFLSISSSFDFFYMSD